MALVMKRTQLTELLNNIKATFVSFFSILMFVALGAGIFIGIASTAPASHAILCESGFRRGRVS